MEWRASVTEPRESPGVIERACSRRELGGVPGGVLTSAGFSGRGSAASRKPPRAQGERVTEDRPTRERSSLVQGTLFLVATPIGNLEDITRRAVRVLAEAGVVAAEDTRRTRRLLDHLGITARLLSLFEHNEKSRIPELLDRLRSGEDVAMVTDAGSPGISDPGFPLVRAAVEAGLRVESVPGPSSVIAALQISGLPTDAFMFAGFLPPKREARRKRLVELHERRETIVVFESPYRIEATLAELEEVWGERPIALARELTKLHEQVLRGTAAEVRSALRADQRRGEMVLVLGGRTRRTQDEPTAGNGA